MNSNLFGFNPKFKDFLEKNPNKTLIGMMWAMYWRFAVIVIAIELAFFAVIFFIAFAANAAFGGH